MQEMARQEMKVAGSLADVRRTIAAIRRRLRQLTEQGDSGEKVLAALERAIPLRRLGRPEDISGMVAFLASDDAEFITGQVISVSGGLTMHG